MRADTTFETISNTPMRRWIAVEKIELEAEHAHKVVGGSFDVRDREHGLQSMELVSACKIVCDHGISPTVHYSSYGSRSGLQSTKSGRGSSMN